MTAHLIPFPTVYRVQIEPDLHQPLLRALCAHTDAEGLPASLGPEPDGSAQAIAILLDSRHLRRLLGAAPAPAGDRPGRAGDFWRLGAVHPADPGRDALWMRIAERDAPLSAYLDWARNAWRIRVYAPVPDAEDCDIVF